MVDGQTTTYPPALAFPVIFFVWFFPGSSRLEASNGGGGKDRAVSWKGDSTAKVGVVWAKKPNRSNSCSGRVGGGGGADCGVWWYMEIIL